MLKTNKIYCGDALKILKTLPDKRDKYKCQKCGSKHIKGNKLVVHHIKPWAKYPKLRFNNNNLITLCEKCHRKIHLRRK